MTTPGLQLRCAGCIYSIFAVLLLPVVVAQSEDEVSARNESDRLYCPVNQFGYFADPTNCSRYAMCINGQLSALHRCPYDLHWHVTSLGFGYCDIQQSAGCQLTSVPDPVDPVEPRFVCPRTLLCGRKMVDGQYGDPFNCSRFHLCIDGESFVSDCPVGMSWSERAGHCDWSQTADCDLRLLQRYGLECVNYTTSDHLTTDSKQLDNNVPDMTTENCSTNHCHRTFDSAVASISNSTPSISKSNSIITLLFCTLCVLRLLT